MTVQYRALEDGTLEAQTRLQPAPAAEQPGPMKYGDYLQNGLTTQAFASKGDRTRYRLKVAAAQALERIGYQDIKVGDICVQAEVALGTFYVYYKDKNEISMEVVLDFVEHLYDQAREAGRGKSEFDAIVSTNRFFIAAYSANAGLMKCHVQLESQLSEYREVFRAKHIKWIEAIGRSIAKRGNYREDMPGTTVAVARALEGMVFHYLYSVLVTRESVVDDKELDADELASMLSTLWYRAVYCKDPPLDGG